MEIDVRKQYIYMFMFLICPASVSAAMAKAIPFLCVVLVFCAIDPGYGQNSKFTIVYQWKQLDFEYESVSAREKAIAEKTFIQENAAPIDTDVFYHFSGAEVFITIPRFQDGIPVTLGTVTGRKLNNNPLIRPYPSWYWHRNPEQCNRDRIVSVFRIKIDECQRLWVLDTGRVGEEQTCPPQILAFDLTTNQLIHRYEIPSDQINESISILVTPVVDVRCACRETFVYVADCQTHSIIVYDVQNRVSWRVTDKSMHPDPNYEIYSIMNDSFSLMDGILGMALSPGKDKLFYHAMSSGTENYVETVHLRNRTRFIDNPGSSPEIFHTYEGSRGTQSAAEAIDRDGIMYFGLMSNVTINCWNTRLKTYDTANIGTVEHNPETLQFASGVKISNHLRGFQELWVVTSRFQKMVTGTINGNEVNFRIQAVGTEYATYNTNCRSSN